MSLVNPLIRNMVGNLVRDLDETLGGEFLFVLDADGNEFEVPRDVLDADGNVFEVGTEVLDADGNPFTVLQTP